MVELFVGIVTEKQKHMGVVKPTLNKGYVRSERNAEDMTPSFSIVIPVHNRPKQVLRAIDSILRQSYEGPIQVVVVDDGSTDDTWDVVTRLAEADHRIDGIHYEDNRGRVAARNRGMQEAKNTFALWLDSDDELYSGYLEIFADFLAKNPEVRLATCGAAVYNDKTHSFHIREAFSPLANTIFKSGKIGTGSFVFRREDYVKLPESRHPYGGSDSFSGLVQEKYPEIAALYGKNDFGSYHPLGNAWGDDYVEFFLLTRENDAVAINMPLYIQHVRP